jgi:hypothetical protein
MLVSSAPPRTLGVANPRVRFGPESQTADGQLGRRLAFLDEKPAFELSFWCGTCQFLFQRLEGANDTTSLAESEVQLADGLEHIDDEIVERFAQLLPRGQYVPLLLQVQPELVYPAGGHDYFSVEQVATWGINAFWGLPEHPHTPYYRTYTTPVDREAQLFEFVVPMVPPTWNDPIRVEAHAQILAASSRPTAVAVSTLDVCAPAEAQGVDWYTHWGLTHFVLDGHHKLQAAAETGKPLQLLSLLSVDASLASTAQVATALQVRRQPAEVRA